MTDAKLQGELDLVLTKCYNHTSERVLLVEGWLDYDKLENREVQSRFLVEFKIRWLSYEKKIRKFLPDDNSLPKELQFFHKMTQKLEQEVSSYLVQQGKGFTYDYFNRIKRRLVISISTK